MNLGSTGLESTTASAKMLNIPFAAFVLPGPRRERSVRRDFAVREVDCKQYRSWGRDRAFGIESRTINLRVLALVVRLFADEEDEAAGDAGGDREVYTKGQLSGKATYMILDASRKVWEGCRGCRYGESVTNIRRSVNGSAFRREIW